MKGYYSSTLSRLLQPYLFIALTGMLAFAPVSFMLKALKNDIVAIEFPVKYFISECIRNNEIPAWFNTWAMGFPLQSSLTWGIYSTPQLIFSSLFNYNIYVLHIEFIFYVLLAGWGMFYLLKKHFSLDEKIAQVTACCFMLSGFVTGSSQWLLYLTAAAFVPLLIITLLQLVKFPSFKNVLLFVVLYYLMFTSVYQAFNIISTYCIIVFIVFQLIKSRNDSLYFKKLALHFGLAAFLIVLCCAPCLYYTFELLQYMERGNPIAGDTVFFNSNYLPPQGLYSLLLPLTSARMHFPNTEGAMFNSYAGLFVLFMLPLALFNIWGKEKWKIIVLLSISIFFLLISFGNILPFRNLLNILPGLEYFRNPGIFRFYFILFLVFTLAAYLSGKNFKEILNAPINKERKLLTWCFIILVIGLLLGLLLQINKPGLLELSLSASFIKEISFPQTVFVNSILQLLLLLILLFIIKKKKIVLLPYFFAAELIANTLLCTPYFTVSNYSLPQVNKILKTSEGFPVQKNFLSVVPAVFQDQHNNNWYNINVFTKEVSDQTSYWGPLTLKSFGNFQNTNNVAEKPISFPLVYITDKREQDNSSIVFISQQPSQIIVKTKLSEDKKIRLQQNYFPGWKAYYNNSNIPIIEKDEAGITVSVPKGEGQLKFKFDKKGLWISAGILHLLVLLVLAFTLFKIFRSLKH